MEAIYQNLLKGGKVLLAETTKQQKALDDLKIKAAQEYNLLLARQQDILKALSGDNKVTIEEVGLLAKSWGMSAEAAQFYVNQVLSIGDERIDTGEVERLALMWYGNTGESATKSAGKYLDFLNEINKGNGNISAEGIKKLALKWYGSDGASATEAARKYEQATVALKDNNIGKAEVELLMKAWNASADEVAAYLLETKVPFTVEEDAKVMFSPSIIAAIAAGWNAATTALEKYLAAAKAAAGIVIPTAPVIPGAPVVTPKAGDPVVTPKAGDPSAVAAAAATRAAESAAAAAAYAAAKAAGDMNAAAIAAAGVNPSALAAQESGAIGAASIAAQLRAAEAAQRAAANAAAQATQLANFRAKEAADAAASQAAASALDYDERSKFRAAQGVMASAGDSGFKGLRGGGDIYIDLNVQGDIQTKEDIVQAIRQGLLAGQTNGQGLTLQAI
jgi:hypothetical protein